MRSPSHQENPKPPRQDSPDSRSLKNPTVPKAQLYNLASDPAEKANLYETNPTKADELLAALKNDIQRGRSTDGPESSNDSDLIVIWKSPGNNATGTDEL